MFVTSIKREIISQLYYGYRMTIHHWAILVRLVLVEF